MKKLQVFTAIIILCLIICVIKLLVISF